MKFSKVYVVTKIDEVVFASEDIDEARGFAESKQYQERESVLNEWDNDDPDERDLGYAEWQAGADGEYYEVEEVDLSNKTEDDTVELENGNEVEVADILEMLRHNN